ncbi:hypothetical protein [Mitsuaria sp. 7]|uniref:hypothetical protein n=1 Tax=Mitsuaria sp. 7 TaxID=1658665 RepID=UPI0007DD5406|nr:hypothetical protein [Mitsuaria sp. 7]ANH66569.1 hypothetical protein ABE85_01535 [Mitsuaria sp. 7]
MTLLLPLIPARRVTILSLALMAAMPALAADGGIRETCPKSASVVAGAASAASDVPGSGKGLTTIDLVLVTADFTRPGLVAQEPDEHWHEWKLDEVNRLFVERAPKVLSANGLDGRVIVLPATPQGEKPDFSTLEPNRPALVMVPAKYEKWRPKPLSPKAGAVTYALQTMNLGPDMPQPKCQVEIWGGVGMDSTWGLFKTNVVDAEWIDTRLTGALTMMARQGVVKLSGETAARPKD